MASSTTVPIANTRANRVKRFIENPINDMTANVPMIDTNIDMVGIRVDFISCKKTYTTITTSSIASNSVRSTEFMEAYRNLLVSVSTTNSIPSGRSRLRSSRTPCISFIVLDAFDPDFWFIIIIAAGCPFTSDE